MNNDTIIVVIIIAEVYCIGYLDVIIIIIIEENMLNGRTVKLIISENVFVRKIPIVFFGPEFNIG